MLSSYGTYRGAVIASIHKIVISDAYRGELFGILLGITALQVICSRHDVNKGSATLVCDGASALRSAQDHNISHPIDKVNADLWKLIVTMRN